MKTLKNLFREVFWRSYWRGWLEGRPEVWEKYKKSLNELVEQYKFGVSEKKTTMMP